MGAKYVIDEYTLRDIADSIREKTGGALDIAPEDMAEEILRISGAEDLNDVLTAQENLIAELKRVITSIEIGGGTPAEDEYKKLYQRVTYIESDEAETYPYIITDFIGNNASGLEIIASFPTMQDRIPMGSRLNSDPTRFYCVYPLSTSSIYYGFNTGVAISCSLKVDTIYRLQTNFLNSRLVNVYDESGARKGGGSISNTLTQQTAPVSIFGYNYAGNGSVSSKREYKLYSARCSQGHEVVREYIPCYRKSDGVVGVYEKYTGQFLTPEVSAFAKGADIDW